MSVETDVVTALKSLVGNRISPDVFPQPPAVPTWPAIRYTIVDRVPVNDLCGDGDDSTADIRVQLDAVAETKAAVLALRLQIMAAMRSFSPPARLDLTRSGGYDPDARVYVETLDYVVYGSS